MTFSLSIPAMLRLLYARGALAWAGRRDEAPGLLAPVHEAALRELIRGSFIRLCLDLAPYLESTGLDDTDVATDDMLTLTLRLPPATEPSSLRAAMEHAVALRALTGVLTGISPDEASAVARETAAALDTVVSTLTSPGESPARITAAWL